MRIHIISPGKVHDPDFRAAIETYQQRLERVWPITWDLVRPGALEEESQAILKRIDPGDAVLVLDERGSDMGSVAFADVVQERILAGTKRIVFVIGGAYGVSDEVRKRADILLSLSAMTLPHQLVRLFLVEQLYRAHSILSGGKYHHG